MNEQCRRGDGAHLVFGDTEVGPRVARVEEHGAVSLVGAVGDAGLIADLDKVVGNHRWIDCEVVAQQCAHRLMRRLIGAQRGKTLSGCHANGRCTHQHHLGDPVRSVGGHLQRDAPT